MTLAWHVKRVVAMEAVTCWTHQLILLMHQLCGMLLLLEICRYCVCSTYYYHSVRVIHVGYDAGFIGYVSELYKLVTRGQVNVDDDDQRFYTKLFLDQQLRVSLTIEWSVSLVDTSNCS